MSKHNHKKKKHPVVEEIELENILKEPEVKSFKLNIKQFNFTEKQKQLIKLGLDKDTKVIFISGPAGTSKAQPLSSKILSKDGWIKMGDVKPGTLVFGEDGKTHSVLSVHPQGIKDVYKVSFSDGTSTECTLDHLWLTQTSQDRNHRTKVKGIRYKSTERRGTVKTTKQILETLIEGRKTKQTWNHSIPISQPVEFSEKTHFISPYLMGVLLGDGCFRNKTVYLSCAEEEILKRVAQELPEGMELHFVSRYDYTLKHKTQKLAQGGNKIKNELKRLGVDNHLSYEKFVPDEYLFDSIKNRIDILRGLLDTDGHVQTQTGSSYFSTTSEKLMESVRFLVESLGGVCKVNIRQNWFTYLDEKKQGRDSYSMCICLPPYINPFHLSRKYNLVKPKTRYQPIRYIVNVELVKQEECQCILIDSPSHLYLTNNFIVTHNTLLAVYIALRSIIDNQNIEVKYVRTLAESAEKSLGSLPGETMAKISPFMMPLLDKLAELLPPQQAQFLIDQDIIQAMPINHVRGASWRDKVAIFEEAQGASFKELVTFISRIGEQSRFLIIGDPDQSDIGDKSGFKKMFNLFNTPESVSKGIHCFEFFEEDIMRSEILKYIVSVFKKLPNQNNGNGKYQI